MIRMKTALVCQLLKIDGFFHGDVLLKMSEDFCEKKSTRPFSVIPEKNFIIALWSYKNLTNSTYTIHMYFVRLSQLFRIYAFIRDAAFGAWTFPEGAAIAHLLVASGLATREV
jgi:hypothetical protein